MAVLTARSGQWYPMTVRNLLARSGRRPDLNEVAQMEKDTMLADNTDMG